MSSGCIAQPPEYCVDKYGTFPNIMLRCVLKEGGGWGDVTVHPLGSVSKRSAFSRDTRIS